MKKFWLIILTCFVIIVSIVTNDSLNNVSLDNILLTNNQSKNLIVNAQEFPLNNPSHSLISNNNNISLNNKEYPVVFYEQNLFYIKVPLTNISPETRAERMSEAITKFAEDYSVSTDDLTVNKLTSDVFLISVNNIPLVSLIEADAKANNTTLEKLATSYQEKIITAVANYRKENSFQEISKDIVACLAITFAFIILVKILWAINSLIVSNIQMMQMGIFRSIRFQRLQLVSVKQQKQFLVIVIRLMFASITIILFLTYLGLLFQFFPKTKTYGDFVFNAFKLTLKTTWTSIIDYLPALFTIIITLVITYYIIRFTKIFFNALDNGDISIPGFHQEWAKPTYNLTVGLSYALALAIIFPYLPGSGSPAFRGISVFIGALFTFGGASAISNFIGGIIVIYTRAYQIGDLVKVGEITGNVFEKTILSTRIRTPNNQIVTIPNSSIVSNNIINYTASNRELKEPLILNTTITLGYDVPWRKVHETLIKAALATKHISHQYSPFVLQTSLNDFCVSYELKAYTELDLPPSRIPLVYSELHQNIQDKCNEVGIEILSPHYYSIRDGNHNTIPDNYLPSDYQAPSFRIENNNKQ